MSNVDEDELEAIYGVIRSSLMLLGEDGNENDESFIGASEALSSYGHSSLSL